MNTTIIPLQVGTEIRIKKGGELAISNPTVELAPEQADAVLSYHLDEQTGDHVIPMVEPRRK